MNVLAPSHWRPVKAKRLFAEVDRRGFADEELLAATQANGVVPRSSLDYRVWNPTKDLENYKLVEPGQFAISLRSFQGGIEYSEHRGIVSPAYTVMALTGDGDPRFFRHLLKSTAVVGQLDALGSGIRQGKNISFASFGGIVLIMPPLREQMMIADFLYRETARIDQLVAKKKRLIELLEEKRTSAIIQAVTKGLDPSVRMKDLGIPWLGEIPAHWGRRPLKSLVDFRKGKDAQRITAEFIVANSGPYPVFSGQTENAGLMGSIDSYDFDAPEGVILVTTVGKVGTTRILDGRFSLSQNCALMTPKTDDVNLRFLRYQLDPLFSYEASRVPMSAGRWSLRIEDLRTYRVYLPGAEEQKSVAAHLDGVTEHIDHTTALISKQVELLAEYRQALITAAVTGEIGVPVGQAEPREAIA